MDLIATVSLNRMEGIRVEFDLVQRALKENYPQLRRILPAQLPEAIDRLVSKGQMEPDVALSVKQLYELLIMPEWQEGQAGDTCGYAFLMLAEGAIHSILRSAQTRSAGPAEDAADLAAIGRSWSGNYSGRFKIDLGIGPWSGNSSVGIISYLDDDTATKSLAQSRTVPMAAYGSRGKS